MYGVIGAGKQGQARRSGHISHGESNGIILITILCKRLKMGNETALDGFIMRFSHCVFYSHRCEGLACCYLLRYRTQLHTYCTE